MNLSPLEQVTEWFTSHGQSLDAPDIRAGRGLTRKSISHSCDPSNETEDGLTADSLASTKLLAELSFPITHSSDTAESNFSSYPAPHQSHPPKIKPYH